MQTITSVAEMMRLRDEWRLQGRRVGIVPTMGYLHAGHLSLVQHAKAENELVVTTIFVNPLQFGPKEDFSRYPRNFERDAKLLEEAGADYIFNPTPDGMYPAGFQASVEVGGVTEVLEGAVRPGHFKGVTTVVAKLFNIVGAQRAYFGQKDAQQVVVIKKMVADLNFPVQIVICPTQRESDGLAMSSRNIYLNPEERKAATVLYRALSAAKALWEAQPNERSGPELRAAMQHILEAESLAKPDYVSAANPNSLEEYNGSIANGQGVLLSLAVRFGTTRLIDNFLLDA